MCTLSFTPVLIDHDTCGVKLKRFLITEESPRKYHKVE